MMKFTSLDRTIATIIGLAILYGGLMSFVGTTDPAAILVDFVAGGSLIIFITVSLKKVLTVPKPRPSIAYLIKEGFITINPDTTEIDTSKCPYTVDIFRGPVTVIFYPDDHTNAYAVRFVKVTEDEL